MSNMERDNNISNEQLYIHHNVVESELKYKKKRKKILLEFYSDLAA
jgi:hypothetical protein